MDDTVQVAEVVTVGDSFALEDGEAETVELIVEDEFMEAECTEEAEELSVAETDTVLEDEWLTVGLPDEKTDGELEPL